MDGMSRREFVELMAAAAIAGAVAIGWDAGANGGRPAEETGDDEEPPI